MKDNETVLELLTVDNLPQLEYAMQDITIKLDMIEAEIMKKHAELYAYDVEHSRAMVTHDDLVEQIAYINDNNAEDCL
jgi:hypothetical protein